MLYLPNYYKSKTGGGGESADSFCLKIDWSNDTDKQIFSFAKVAKCNQIKKICFENLQQEESKEILDYLTENCPEELEAFCFTANTPGCIYGEGDYYLKGIEKVELIYR